MNTWWKKRKAKTRRSRKHPDQYTFWDGFFDALFWIPELVILPFRIIWWMLRGFGRIMGDLFNFGP